MDSTHLPAHGWPLTPLGAQAGADPANGADAWNRDATETQKQVEAKPAVQWGEIQPIH